MMFKSQSQNSPAVGWFDFKFGRSHTPEIVIEVQALAWLKDLETRFVEECCVLGIALNYYQQRPASHRAGMANCSIQKFAADSGKPMIWQNSDEFKHWEMLPQELSRLMEASALQVQSVINVTRNQGGTDRLIVLNGDEDFSLRATYCLGDRRSGHSRGFVSNRGQEQLTRCVEVILAPGQPASDSHTERLMALTSAFRAASKTTARSEGAI